MSSDNKSIRLVKNTGLFIIGSLVSKLLTYILIPFYTSILTTTEFGICDTLFTTVSLLYPIFTLIISEAVLRFAIDKEYDRKQVFSIGFWFTLVGFVIILMVSPLLLLFEGMKSLVAIAVLFYLSVTMQVLFTQFCKGIKCTIQFTIAGILGTIITLITTILFLRYFQWGIKGYLLAYILGNFTVCFYLEVTCKLHKYIITPRKISKSIMKDMLRYSLPIIPNSASWWIGTSSDRYILNGFCGYNVTGIYSIAYKIPSLMTTITSMFLNAWQISAVEEYGSEDVHTYFNKIYDLFSSVLFISVGILIPISKVLSRILFADGFFEAWVFVPVLLFAYLFHDLSAYIGSLYAAAKETKILFTSTLLGALINIALNIALIPIWKAQGAAIATAFSFFVVWFVRIIDKKKVINLTINKTNHLICSLFLTGEIILFLTGEIWSLVTCWICLVGIFIANYKNIVSTANYLLSIFVRRKEA